MFLGFIRFGVRREIWESFYCGVGLEKGYSSYCEEVIKIRFDVFLLFFILSKSVKFLGEGS